MNPKIKFRLALTNTFIVVFCLSICAYFIWLFVKDLNKSSVRTDKDSIATITFKYRIAQRKYADRTVWERLPDDAPLYDGDTIRTADMSQATINFGNNVILDVDENTMFRISVSSDGQLQVSIEDGNIEFDTTASDESISVQTSDGSSVNLESGSRLVAKSDESSTLQMLSGKASVTTESGQVTKVEGGESVKVEKGRDVKKEDITVTSIPTNHKILIFENQQFSNIKLEWNVSKSSSLSDMKVQTSSKKDFSELSEEIYVQNIRSCNLSVYPGTTYWRIVAATSDENTQQVLTNGKISAELVSSVVPVLPQVSQNFSFRKNVPSVVFSWRGNEFATHYKLQVSKTPDYSDLLIEEKVSSNRYTCSFDEGKYYWRVVPYYTLNFSGYYEPTESRSFVVTRRADYENPVLLFPSENATFYYENDSFDVQFAWRSEVNEGKYRIFIADDENFDNIISEFDTSKKNYSAHLSTSDFKKGRYFWKIEQTFPDEEEKNGTKTLVSSARIFDVEKFIPEKSHLLYPSEGFAMEESSVKNMIFLWKDVYGMDAEGSFNTIQISSSESFSPLVLEKKISATEINGLSLKNGVYYWRVKDSMGNFTESRSFTVLKGLEKTQFVYPREKEKVVLKNGSMLETRWNKVEGCDYYKVILRNTDDGTIIAENTVDQSGSVISSMFDLHLDSMEKYGKYSVSVQPFTSETPSNSLRVGQVTVLNFEAKLLAPIILDSVENGVTIPGLTALRKDTVFTWHHQFDEPKSTEFLLIKQNERGGEKVVYTEKNARGSVKIPRLTSGKYRWTVKGTIKNGESIDAEDYYTFTILDVPELSAVRPLSPSMDFVIGPDYLKKNRSISFEWAKVKDATDYSFVLYQKNKDGSLKRIYSIDKVKSEKLQFKNLDLLDVGNFEWRVKAYCHAKDGFVEMTSDEAVFKFKIDFSLPKKVETLQPGIMYGE